MKDIFDLTPGDPHWKIIGVAPTEEEYAADGGFTNSNAFCYTVGLFPWIEMWTPNQSIEGRAAGFDLVAMILNRLALGFHNHELNWGDDVRVPLGVAGGGDDVDTVWWLAHDPADASKYHVNVSDAKLCIPVLWSSPLGWSDEY